MGVFIMHHLDCATKNRKFGPASPPAQKDERLLMQQRSRRCLLAICQMAGPLGRVRLTSNGRLVGEVRVCPTATLGRAPKSERAARRDFARQGPSCLSEEDMGKAVKRGR